MTSLWKLYTISHSLVVISHRLKVLSTDLWVKHELLLAAYRVYENLISVKIKREFFQDFFVSVLLYGCTTWSLRRRWKKSLMGTTQRSSMLFKQALKAASHKTAAVWPLAFRLTNHPNETNKTWWTLLEKQGRTHVLYRHPHLDTPVLAEHLCVDT